MFKFLKINCEMIVNIILVIVIIILLVKMFINPSENLENLKNVDAASIHKVKQAGLTIYVSESCGYCQKLKQMLDGHGLTNFVNFVDVNTPDGKKEYNKLNEQGVPVIKSREGNIVVGYHDIEDLLKKLNM